MVMLSINGGASQSLGPPAGYIWRVKNAQASITGTSTEEATISVGLSRNDMVNIILDVSTTSTVLSVNEICDFYRPDSDTPLYGSGPVLAARDQIVVMVGSGNSYSVWTIEIEETLE